MKLKRLTALLITGVLAFSNVAYATDDAAVLLSTADATKDKVESELLEEPDNASKDSSAKTSSGASSTNESSLESSNMFSEDSGVIYEDADALTDPLDEAVIYEEDEESLEALEDAEESEKAGEASIFDAVDEAEPETTVVEPVFDMMDSDKEIELWEMLDGSYEELIQSYEVTVPEDTEFPVTITFDALVEADDDILVYHFMEDAGEWETIEPDSVEDGFVTATFNSLSPVGIVKIDDEKRDIVDTLTYQEFTESMDGVEISVSGEIPEGYYLTVEALPTSDYADMITEATGNVAAVVYDIKITDGENEYQPLQYGKTLTVLFSGLDSVNEGRMNVVHIDEENGNVEQKSATIDTMNSASEISFETDSFSPYALVIATSRLEIEEGIDATLPFVDDYYGTSTSKIYHMYLTYNSSEKEAFCLDHGLAASTGDTFVQNGQYASSSEVQKILTAYFADENGNGYTLSYSEAQVLIWAAMAGYDTTSDTDSNGTLDYVQIMQAVGDNDESTNATAVATIEGITTYGTFYAWDPSSTYDESAGTYSRDSSKQRFVTLLGKAPVTAADVGTDVWQVGDNAYAYIDDAKVLHITGYGYCWDINNYKYIEPTEYNPSQYTPVGQTIPYYSSGSYLEFNSIDIADEITGLGAQMFIRKGLNLNTQLIPNELNVEYIGSECFSYCVNSAYVIDTLTLNNVEYIGSKAFYSDKIKNIIINSTADFSYFGEIPFDANSSLETLTYNVKNGHLASEYSSSTIISGQPFFNQSSVSDCIIGSDVVNIGKYLFTACSFRSVNFDNATNITSIETGAFSQSTKLTSFTFPESLTTLGTGVITGDSLIDSVYLYSKNLAWDDEALGTAHGYGTIGIVGKNTSLPGYILYIEPTVETLVDHFCANSTYLYGVNFDNSNISEIPNGYFYSCTNLHSAAITFNNDNVVSYIGPSAFSSCTALTDIEFINEMPDLVEVGDSAFNGCTSITSVTLPSSVKRWGTYSLARCTGLLDATVEEDVEIIGYYIFAYDHSLAELNFNAINAQVAIASGNTSNGGDILYSTTGSVIVNIGANVESLASSIFSDASVVEVNFLGNSLRTVGNNCFQSSSILSIDFPEGTETLGAYAIGNCEKLTEVTIPETVTSIGTPLLAKSYKIQELNYNAVNASLNGGSYGLISTLSSLQVAASPSIVNIGANVESLPAWLFSYYYVTNVNFLGNSIAVIPSNAFYQCSNLTSIVIPEGVTTIERYAFRTCPRLTEITIPDTIMTISQNAFQLYGTSWYDLYGDTLNKTLVSDVYDYDRDSDGGVDALTTTLNCSDDNMVARTYAWLSSDNRYVANALSYEYVVSLPMSIELTDPGDGIFVNDLIVSISVVQALDNPLSVVLSKGTFKNADNVEWTDWSLDKTSPSGTVKAVGDYSFDCTVSGTPPTDGSFTGSITCTVTE